MKYFEVSLKYDKMLDNGKVSRVTEKYIADAVSISDAETLITERMKSYISGEFCATSAKETKIEELLGDLECGRYYMAKIGMITYDEKSGKEKRCVIQILVGADDFGSAYNCIKEHFKDSMSDYEIVGLTETPIMDIFKP